MRIQISRNHRKKNRCPKTAHFPFRCRLLSNSPLSGYTLIETLLAMALLLILALPTMQWVENNYRYSADNRERAAAALKLHSLVEELRAGSRTYLLAQIYQTGYAEEREGRYLLQCHRLTAYPVTSGNVLGTIHTIFMEQIKLTLCWNDQWGRETNHEITIALAR